jgi:3-oxoacyl-(acyl-carrier-protein) synthase
MTLANGIIPPTRNYRTPDPEIDLDVVHGSPRKVDVHVMTKHSFGLGGQNACLVLERFCRRSDALTRSTALPAAAKRYDN